ncbi:MAG: hypothetical protein KAJ18_11105 [Candidatus Omnitrophica bacterium]|nr:hypothetical protein [Candidatus Omnitrophota bacterium]
MRKIYLVIIVCLVIVGVGCQEVSKPERSNLTYGMAKKNIIIGETTQADVIKLFGSPDNMILKDGKEMWIYDRFRVESESSSSSGYGTILVAGASGTSSKNSSYVKTITIIIDFDSDSVVEDYNMRVGGY